MKNKALGRGLKALIPDMPVPTTSGTPKPAVAMLPVSVVRINPYQPREHINPVKLQELADSIKSKGLMQPIVVRRQADGYELIAGERRLRAVQLLGYPDVPALVREHISDRDSLELSLLENIQRDDLNPVEEARAYHRLSHEFGLTQETIAQSMGKDRSTVANALRLLKLPPLILEALRTQTLTMGHAKALLGIEDEGEQLRVFEELLTRGSSVRAAETAAARHAPRRRGTKRAHDPEITALEDELARALGTRVRIAHGRRRGKIIIDYYSVEDLERIRQAVHGPRAIA